MDVFEKRIAQTEQFIKNQFVGESTGHDWWHINRVRNNALYIAQKEGADKYIVEMAALLHDLDDWKFNKTDEPIRAHKWLVEIGEAPEQMDLILGIVRNVSFKGAEVKTNMETIEGQCVQDADRLDAIGAIGVARTFAYGGAKGNEIYNPEVKPTLHQSFEDYKTKTSHTVNHFYEKLLLLKDRMNTQTGGELAEQRHQYMLQFLEQFYAEWNADF